MGADHPGKHKSSRKRKHHKEQNSLYYSFCDDGQTSKVSFLRSNSESKIYGRNALFDKKDYNYKHFYNNVRDKIKETIPEGKNINEFQDFVKNANLSEKSKENYEIFLLKRKNSLNKKQINKKKNHKLSVDSIFIDRNTISSIDSSEIKRKKNDFIEEDCTSSSFSTYDVANPHGYVFNLYNKNDKLRKSFLIKLISSKQWDPNYKPLKYNSLIIYDWDDTLLPTNFLTKDGNLIVFRNLNEEEKIVFKDLERNVYNLLMNSISKGNTFIITNAAPGWVEYSTSIFYPSVQNLLSKISIISARGEYEKVYPNDNRKWKKMAFLNMRNKFDKDIITNILSFGDNFIEINATKRLGEEFNYVAIKTIKFQPLPTPQELNKEIKLVNRKFEYYYNSTDNLSVGLEKRNN